MENSERECTVCRKSGSKRCTKCLKVSYCSVDCQQSHWKAHKTECFPVEFHICPETKRRSLAVTKDFSAGEVIWKETPLVFGCFNKRKYEDEEDGRDKRKFCLSCCSVLKPTDNVQCPKCELVLCSQACLQGSTHMSECSYFPIKKATMLAICYGLAPSDFSILFRILNLKKTNPGAWKKFMSLNKHPEPIDLTRLSPSHPELNLDLLNWILISFNDMSNAVRQASILLVGTMEQIRLSGFRTGWTIEDINLIRSMMDWNAVEDPSVSFTKWICYYGSSFRHSCVPNVAWRVDAKHDVHFRALVDMKKGDEVRISKEPYSAFNGTLDRRGKLRHMHGFNCSCERCADPTELGSYANALKCPKGKCPGYLLLKEPLLKVTWVQYNSTQQKLIGGQEVGVSEWKCNTCNQIRDHEWKKSMESELMPKVLTFRREHPFESLDVSGLIKLLKAYEIHVHPNHHEIIPAKEAMMRRLINCLPDALRGLPPMGIGKLGVVDVAKAAIISAKGILKTRNPGFAPWTQRRGRTLAAYFCAAAYLHKHGKPTDWADIGTMTVEDILELREEARKILEFYAADSSQNKKRIAIMDEVMKAFLK